MQLGVIGLGTMGSNLARNAARNGARVAVYNRTTERVDAFMKAYGRKGDFVACKSLEELRDSLKVPRSILIMVQAGQPVDDVIEQLVPLLDKGDILIDGGNSHYLDTERRIAELQEKGVHFLGMGISGGAKGALEGPSLMPGGSEEAWNALKPLLLNMAADDLPAEALAKAGGKRGKCVTFIGPGGAGHFVKMVHNGIEYALMQLIAESYDILKSEGGKTNKELSELYSSWNEGEDLRGYLIEITAKIFKKMEGGNALIDLIKDSAGQKGTGKWTTEAAMDLGVAIPTINAAVDARILSSDTCLRDRLRNSPETVEQPLALSGAEGYPKPEKLVSRVRIALELSMISAYMQGFELIRRASEERMWDVNLSEVSRIWRGGCIIRSAQLQRFQRFFAGDASARKELMSRFEDEHQLDWRRAVTTAVGRGIPVPAMAASLAHYDSLRRELLPQNLIQAQRDFFGAHTYERVDKEGRFHTEWE